MRKRTENENNKKKIAGIFLAIIAITVGIIALILQSRQQKEDERNKEIIDDLYDSVIKEKDDEYIIDWESLKDKNIVGWIKMGEYIDYPIVQGKDNSYYLKRTYNDEYNSNGSIFMHCKNNSDFLDMNTIIYGHRMRNKSMFGSIPNLLSYDDTNPKEFYIYKPDGTKHTYKIYSVDRVKDLGYAYQYQFGSLENFLDYKNQMKENSVYDCGVKQTKNKTVMLSTCDYGSSRGNRIVVLGQESGVKQTQEPVSWYEGKKYIEINNKEVTCLKGNLYYYIIYKDIAIRCREEVIKEIIPDTTETVITRIEYQTTKEAYQYKDMNNEEIIYPIVDVIDYYIE